MFFDSCCPLAVDKELLAVASVNNADIRLSYHTVGQLGHDVGKQAGGLLSAVICRNLIKA